MAPPGREKKREGAWLRKPFSPKRNGEFVISRISQPSARFCIQVPMFERKVPPQNSAKSRERSDRNIDESRRCATATTGTAGSGDFDGVRFMARSGENHKNSFYYNPRSSRFDVTGVDAVSSKTPKLETGRIGMMKKWVALGATAVLGVLLGAWATQAQEAMRPPGPGGERPWEWLASANRGWKGWGAVANARFTAGCWPYSITIASRRL